MTHARSALLALLLAAAPATLPAQAGLDAEAAPRNLLSVGLAGSRGGGALGDQLGGSFRSVRRLEPLGRLGLRVEGGVLLDGREHVDLPGSAGGELRLRNTLVFAGVGPQVQLPRGPVRPYAHAFGGFHYLFTRADIRGPDADGEAVEITSTYEDFAWAYGAGGGVYVPLKRGLMLDAGFTWREGGEVMYTSFENAPMHTETDLTVAHLGITVEL